MSIEFYKSRVLVVGDVMLDRYWHGAASRISPEAPVPVVQVQQVENRPGGAANVALNIVSLGASCKLIGVVGNDEAGDELKRVLEDSGVVSAFAIEDLLPTITKLRVISRQQQLIRLDFEDANVVASANKVSAKFEETVPYFDVVVFSDYGKGALTGINKLIQIAKTMNKRVLVDPKGAEWEKYKGADILTPNMSEFEAVVGKCKSEDDIVTKGKDLIGRLNLEALLVTRGEHGMSLIAAAGEILHLPTHAREVYDVTGAGDTVISVLGACIAAGEEWSNATRIANIAAGIVVGKLGTATVTASELRLAVKGYQEHDLGIVSEKQLIDAVKDFKARGERIVMTNGCFDILHPGHVTYLEQARQLGDRLIVAVNDDESVRRLKGSSRPINTLQNRMAVLAGLSSVDWVVPFSEDTPERLICEVMPDVLVKGGDYKAEQIAGHKCVLENGGQVIVQDFVEGCSTSSIVQRIKDLND